MWRKEVEGIEIKGFEEVVMNENTHFIHLLPKSITRDDHGNIEIIWSDEKGIIRRKFIYPRFNDKVLTFDEHGVSR